MSSLWIETIKSDNISFSSLNKNIDTDVCIIGGGITGISTAYLLAKAGLKVCVLEKNKIAHHTTGNTTAKITSQHGLFYEYLLDTYSKEFAKGYLEANQKAIENIKQIIEENNISCDFERQDNYVYTDSEEELEKIKNEVKVVNALGLDAQYVEKLDVPFSAKGAIKFPNQAQFNPLKYVYGLLNKITENKGEIYENTKVYDVKKEKDMYITYTEEYNVTSKYVVLASHYPIINVPGFYFLKMYQEASYIIGIETNAPLFEGMYINTKVPITSFRTAIYKGKKILLIGGSDHKVGAEQDLSKCYDNLEKVAKTLYPDAKVLFRWQTQDCIPLDKIPYIGEFSNMMPNFYVATGFKKWGMTSSNVAANIIADKILGKENPYENIFTSTRLKPIKNGTEFVDMIKQVSNSLVIDKFKKVEETLNEIEKDEEKIVEIDSTKVGVYRDKEGKYFAVKPVCSHLGCELSWNNLEKTWDCPCHGSRFDYKGKSLYDPSIKDLQLINIE